MEDELATVASGGGLTEPQAREDIKLEESRTRKRHPSVATRFILIEREH